MSSTNIRFSLIFFLLAAMIVSCKEPSSQAIAPVAPLTAPDVRDITTQLPEAPGYQTFNINCLTCHSAAYIQNQPNLPEKTWTAIVTKMQKTFGAPVADSSVKEIVQYLVTIKGKS